MLAISRDEQQAMHSEYEINIDEYPSSSSTSAQRPIITISTAHEQSLSRTSKKYPQMIDPADERWFGSDLIDKFEDVDTRSDSDELEPLKRHESQRSETTTTTTNRATDQYGFFIDDDSNYRPAMPIVKLKRREQKWREMERKWQFLMESDFDLIKRRCRKGIPPTMRSRVWPLLCGACSPTKYDDNGIPISFSSPVYEALQRMPDQQPWCDDIDKDLDRQFPGHEMFARGGAFHGIGQDSLRRVLRAYALTHPHDGYCQGQAPVAATLLMSMPEAQAYHCLQQICDHYLQQYYSPGLQAVQLDGYILHELLKRREPMIYKLLKKHDVSPTLYTIEWFMCIYSRTLPWNCAMRVWDMFLCEGVKVLFKVALVLLRGVFGSRRQMAQCTDMYAVLQVIRGINDQQAIDENKFVDAVSRIELSEDELRKIHYKKLKLMKAVEGK